MDGNKRKRDKEEVKLGDHHEGDFGVYMSHKILKLRDQFDEEEDNDESEGEFQIQGKIFDGVQIYIDGMTQLPIQEIRRLIVSNGGRFEAYNTSVETIIIADNLPDTKLKQLLKRSRIPPIVTSDWIIDSIRSGIKLPMGDYLVPGIQSALGNSIVDYFQKPSNSTTDSRPRAVNNMNEVELSTSSRMPTAADPGFVKRYFQTSRLHFIGSWRMRAQQQMSLAHPTSSSLSACGRVVIHIDMDCFFVSALIKDKPHLQTRPVAVAHSASKSFSSSSEISSCNYVARAFGLRNGMFLGEARQKCPDLIMLSYDFDVYHKVRLCTFVSLSFDQLSSVVHAIFMNYLTPKQITIDGVTCVVQAVGVEPVSVDEAYLEFPPLVKGQIVASAIREEICRETGGCTASAGIGPNKFLARMATKRIKPNGQTSFFPEDFNVFDKVKKEEFVRESIGRLNVDEIPGVGWKTRSKLKDTHNVTTINDLYGISKKDLRGTFGPKTGDCLYDKCRGVDDDVVGKSLKNERQSVSAELSWGIRFSCFAEIERFMVDLVDELCDRLGLVNSLTSLVSIKVLVKHPDAGEPYKLLGHGKCNQLTGSKSLAQPINDKAYIYDLCWKLLSDMNLNPVDVRGIGLHCGKLKKMVDATASRQQLLLVGVTESVHELSDTEDNVVKDDNDEEEVQIVSTARRQDKLTSAPPRTVDSFHKNQASSSSSSRIAQVQPRTFSQLDSETLEDLPQEIQDELKAEYESLGRLSSVRMGRSDATHPSKRSRSSTAVSSIQSFDPMFPTLHQAKLDDYSTSWNVISSSNQAERSLDPELVCQLPLKVRLEIQSALRTNPGLIRELKSCNDVRQSSIVAPLSSRSNTSSDKVQKGSFIPEPFSSISDSIQLWLHDSSFEPTQEHYDILVELASDFLQKKQLDNVGNLLRLLERLATASTSQEVFHLFQASSQTIQEMFEEEYNCKILF